MRTEDVLDREQDLYGDLTPEQEAQVKEMVARRFPVEEHPGPGGAIPFERPLSRYVPNRDFVLLDGLDLSTRLLARLLTQLAWFACCWVSTIACSLSHNVTPIPLPLLRSISGRLLGCLGSRGTAKACRDTAVFLRRHCRQNPEASSPA
jgi:hypothetical protein